LLEHVPAAGCRICRGSPSAAFYAPGIRPFFMLRQRHQQRPRSSQRGYRYRVGVRVPATRSRLSGRFVSMTPRDASASKHMLLDQGSSRGRCHFTYRDAPLDGVAPVAMMEHSVLGTRWVTWSERPSIRPCPGRGCPDWSRRSIGLGTSPRPLVCRTEHYHAQP
jgi:hypothetical protein